MFSHVISFDQLTALKEMRVYQLNAGKKMWVKHIIFKNTLTGYILAECRVLLNQKNIGKHLYNRYKSPTGSRKRSFISYNILWRKNSFQSQTRESSFPNPPIYSIF